jgi:hypothetical protein
MTRSRIRKNVRMAAAFALLTIALSTLLSCPTPYDGPVNTAERTIRVDVSDTLFNAYNEVIPTDRGIGATTVTVTVTTDVTTYTGALAAGALDAAYRYTQVPLTVSGTLLGVAVSVAAAGGQTFSAELTDWDDTESLSGWTTFANLLKFRLTAKIASGSVDGSALVLEPGPKGGTGLRLLCDTGVTDPDFGYTDRAATLAAGDVAIAPQWLENPAGLTYTLYAAVVNENLQALYDPVYNAEAEYAADPWTGAWTVDEITSITGKSIAGDLVPVHRVAASVDALDPMDDGLSSYLRDFSAYIGQYLILALVATDGALSVPSQVVIVPIE